MSETVHDKITMSVDAFLRAADIGRTKLYVLLKEGDLESIRIGKKRLIIVDSYLRLIDKQMAAARKVA